MAPKVKSKEGDTIKVGDHVYTRFRGGRHEGEVERVVTIKKEAEEQSVKHPPKVIFTDQKGKRVAHNPHTLSKLADVSEKGTSSE